MALGGEIKVALILDESGFSTKIAKATENLSLLGKDFKGLSEKMDRLEGRMGTFGNKVTITSQKFNALHETLDKFAAKMNATADSMGKMSVSSDKAAAGVDELNKSLTPLERTLKTVEAETDKFVTSLMEVTPVTLKAIFNFKELAAAQKVQSQETKQAQAALSNLARTVDGAVAESRKLAAETLLVGDAMLKNSIASIKEEGALRAKNATMEQEVALRRQTAIAAQETAAVKARAAAEEAMANMGILKTIQAVDVETRKLATDTLLAGDAMLKNAADTIKAEGAARAHAESLVLQRKNIKGVTEEVNSLNASLKGMAQLWAASKVEKGILSTFSEADKFQREQMVVSSLNLPKDQTDYITNKAFDDSKVLKFVSALDMIKARMAAIGGLGSNNVKAIDDTLESAVKVAHNIQYMTGDNTKQGLENMVRNLYGVVEARQQTNDPAAAKKTFDLMQKMYSATGRKIDIADMETFLRRDGPGANKISDEGLASIVAFLDQAKVSGGHGGGGGAGGVSTVGTMVKMFQKMANGGLMTEGAAKEFAGAGLIDASVMDGKSGKEAMKALRHGGLNIADLANANPVEALEKISKAALGYMTKPENLKKFFPSGDTTSPDAIKNAMMKFAIGTGWSTNAVAMLTTAGDPMAMQRAHDQQKTIMNAKGGNEFNDEVMKSYGGNVDAFNASLNNLKVTLGTTVLPALTELFGLITDIVKAAADFAKNNPLTSQMTLMAAGAASVVLGIKGFKSVFGIVGDLSSVLRTMLGDSTKAAVGQAALGTAIEKTGATTAASTGLLGRYGEHVRSQLSNVGGAFTDFATNVAGRAASLTSAGTSVNSLGGTFKMLGTTVMETGKMVAKGFLRLLPLVGELLIAWDLASLVGNLEVGGVQIKVWAASLMDYLITKFKNGWEWIKDITTLGMNHAEHAKTRAGNDAQHHSNDKANGITTDQEKAALAAEAKAAAGKVEASKKATEEAQRKLNEQLAAKAGANGKPFNTDTLGNGKRTYENPLDVAIETAKWRVQVAKSKLDALNGQVDAATAIQRQVEDEIIGRWKAGGFNDEKDKNKKPHQELLGKSMDDIRANLFKDSKFANLRGQEVQLKGLDNESKDLSFASEKESEAQRAFADSVDRTNAGLDKQTARIRALTNEFARHEGADKSLATDANWQRKTSGALFDSSLTDLNDFSTDLSSKTDKSAAKSLADPLAQKAALFDKQTQDVVDAYNTRMAEAKKERDAAIKNGNDKTKAELDYLNTAQNAEKAYSAWSIQRSHERTEALKTPLQALQESWGNAMEGMRNVEVEWANTTLSTLEKIAKGGKVSFKELASSFVMPVLNVALKQSLSNLIGPMFSGAGSAIGNFLGGGASKAAEATAAQAATTGLTTVSASAVSTTAGLTALTAQTVLNETAQATATASITLMTNAAFSAAAALSSVAASGGSAGSASFVSSMFAGGGVMTGLGPVALRKYAAGGIADSPQLAMFGEGSSPEAYVPLPDGRSIPVSIKGKGGSGDGVLVNITIYESGKSDKSASGQNKEFWAGFGERVKAVVQQELVTQKRDGGLLYK